MAHRHLGQTPPTSLPTSMVAPRQPALPGVTAGRPPLGVGGRLPALPRVAPLSRPPAPPVDPLSIVPAECSVFERVAAAPDPIPANTQVVTSWPLVTATDDQVANWFAQVLGTPAGTGGPALLRGLAVLPDGAQLASAGAGFMRDPDASGSGPNGLLWLSLSFAGALPRATVQRVMSETMLEALRAPGAPSVGSPRTTLPIVCQGDSDQELQAAATQSAVGQFSVASIFGALLGVVNAMTRPGSLSTKSIVDAASDINNAVGAVSRINDIAAEIDVGIAAALAAPVEQAAQMQAALTTSKTQVAQLKATIQRAMVAAPQVREQATTGRSDLVKRIRDEVVRGVESKVVGQPGFIREVAKCQYLSMAERVLRADVARLEEALNGSLANAMALMASPDQVAQASALLDTLTGRIDYALQQLPLSWLERNWKGAPAWMWLAGGSTVFIGGAAVLRARKKKAAAAAAPVAKNRRTSRRRA